MEKKVFSKSSFSPITLYSILTWTIVCFTGTWFVIFKYGVPFDGILFDGLIAIVMTFFFAAIIWGVISLTGFILLSLYVTPSEESSPYVMFKDLIKKGIRGI
mgnify:CR=1 FL=1